ncbi:isochorismatase family cysteine hydrolase [Amycolatopsis minnesotensis]|uniref:Pyrazinamidase PncA n=1 Tax=Amycolatopsis minnesotensis TaxID=337894 RepID=A0ABN2S609_9PSEU
MADTALIVVDVQNLFVAVTGDEGLAAVAAINEYVAKAVANEWPVYYLRDYRPDADTDPHGDDTLLHPALDVRGTVVEKGPGHRGALSGFLRLPTDMKGPELGAGGLSQLAEHLARDGVMALVVTGIATDVCVSATAVDAVRLGYEVTVPLSACAPVHAHPDGDDAAVEALREAGVTVIA